MKRTILNYLGLLIFAPLLALTFTACQQDTGDELEDAAEEAMDTAGDAADDVEDAAQDVADEVEDEL